MEKAVTVLEPFVFPVVRNRIIDMSNVDKISKEISDALSSSHEETGLYILWLKNSVYSKYLSDLDRKNLLERDFPDEILKKFVYS